MLSANWTEGQPEELARQFLGAVGRQKSDLGTKNFVEFVKALTAASIHNVLESDTRSSQHKQPTNILQTATAIVVAVKTYSPDRTERNRCKKQQEATFSAATAAAVAAALAPGAPALRQLQKLQNLVQQHLLQQQAAAGAGTLSAQTVQQAAADNEACCDSGLLLLPAPLLQAVVCCCDSRTAAAAAASCKQLRTAVAAQQFLQVPAALQLYLAAVSETAEKEHSIMMGETGDGFSDAVRSFTGQFPLDGSAAAGADLRAKAGLKSLKDGYKFLANSWRQIFGPNAAAELQLQQELTCADIKRPAPDSSSSPGGGGGGCSERRGCRQQQRCCAARGACVTRSRCLTRAPKSLGGPRNCDAACNRGKGNGMQLQYTLDAGGAAAGLYVAGTKVLAVASSVGLFSWGIAELEPQQHWKVSNRAVDPEASESDDGDTYIGDRDDYYSDDRDADDFDCIKGTPPHTSLRLQRPSSSSSIFKVHQTCLLTAAGHRAPDTLAAACSALYCDTNIVITYDLETQRAKRLLIGHCREVSDMAAAPAAWHGAQHVFATAAESGDVKIWDVRSSGGAAAITLAGADYGQLNAVTLAASSSSSGSSQLGSGLYCFGEAVQELSTGNLDVTALAWHEASSSLIASCSSSYEDLIDYRMEPESDSDDNSDGEERWWPTTAAHGMKDFRAYFVKSRSATLCYTFSSSAAKKVPRSDDC
uniref:Uncharacterized protein n=1 Tax=Tetradesmus obliquus TaxID=3088 RepID=A0A383VJP0_TETOB